MRFRNFELDFKVRETRDDDINYRDNKVTREVREIKSDNDVNDKDAGDSRDVKSTRDSRDLKSTRDSRDLKSTRDSRDVKSTRDSRDIKSDKDVSDMRNNTDDKINMDCEDSGDVVDNKINRDVRDGDRKQKGKKNVHDKAGDVKNKGAKSGRDVKDNKDEDIDEENKNQVINYPSMSKTLTDGKTSFKINIEAGSLYSSEVLIALGRNGCGKTTMINMLAGLIKPDTINGISVSSMSDSDIKDSLPSHGISLKPQKLSATFEGTVKQLLQARIPAFFNHSQFQTDVMKPLKINELLDEKVKTLSGGQIQRLACTMALGKPAQFYLIDEPSTYIDVVDKLNVAKAIRRFIIHSGKTAIIIEHDMLVANYLADRVIVFSGTPAVGILMAGFIPSSCWGCCRSFLTYCPRPNPCRAGRIPCPSNRWKFIRSPRFC